MKKLVLPLIAGILLLSACQNSEPKKVHESKPTTEKPQQTVESKKDSNFPYQNLLAENNRSYSVLVIGENEDQSPIEEDQTIIKDVTNILSLPNIATVEKVYPKLPIENKSAYLLFDNNGMVHQSTSLKELKRYLVKNPIN
ncbi:hypothetical protein [Neobacillus drentensis]|uniref:hypothetical protein n=1 Tax=Neobacillus drentensis TaxID=220684 RepID=UPI002FFDA0AB